MVNDTYGHAAGDRLLESVAERLRSMLRAGDLPARPGGDEFVVLAADCTVEEAAAFGRRLIEVIGAPYDLGFNGPARIGVSVGIAMAPEHRREAADLLRAADAALYEAKSDGGSRCQLASCAAHVAIVHRLHGQSAEPSTSESAAA